jgi:hypothetical protein
LCCAVLLNRYFWMIMCVLLVVPHCVLLHLLLLLARILVATPVSMCIS